MRPYKIVLITLGAVTILFSAYTMSYSVGKKAGYAEGYGKGYDVGYADGVIQGEEIQKGASQKELDALIEQCKKNIMQGYQLGRVKANIDLLVNLSRSLR